MSPSACLDSSTPATGLAKRVFSGSKRQQISKGRARGAVTPVCPSPASCHGASSAAPLSLGRQ
eukprot:14216473-Alexandrium_andersonii.AAC.1